MSDTFTPIAPEELLFDRLDKVRRQRTSKNENQKQYALILEAVEENLTENKDENTPTAYFVSFLSLMEQAISEEKIEDKKMADCATYFLDIVAPYVSAPLLRSKFDQIVQKLGSALMNQESDAPLLRAAVGTLEAVLLAQDSSCWQRSMTEISPKRIMTVLMQLSMDPRAKVRKRARDAVTRVLSNPPPSPKIEHPASDICAESSLGFVKNALQESKKTRDSSKVAHALQAVEAVTNANGWPSDKLDVLCESLLMICKTNDQKEVSSAFNVFTAVFKSITDEVGAPKLLKILDTIMDLIPPHHDVNIAPAWLAVVAQAGESYADLQPKEAFERLPEMFKTVSGFLESESDNVKTSAAQCMVALATTAIPTDVLKLSNKSKQTDKILDSICQTVFGLMNIKYIDTWNETMEVLVALYDKLRWRSNPHLVNALKVVGVLRSQDSFADGREAADKAISAAIRALGPEMVLEHLPLNLEQEMAGQEQGRAWLLPLLRENVQFANLGHFIDYFVPVGDQLKSKGQEIRDSGDLGGTRGVQAKLYETLYDQVWSLLPRYMDLPFDLQDSFNEEFAQTLATTLYEDVEKRPGICQSLRLLVQSNQVYATGEIDDDELLLERFPVKAAKKNVDFLASNYALNILKVLFNVFMSTNEQSRAYVRECIEAYLGITTDEDIVKSFNEVSTALMGQLDQEKQQPDGKFDHSMTRSIMDIIITMSRFLPESSMQALARIYTVMVVREDNAQLQKRAFRLLTKMAETDAGLTYLKKNVSALEQSLIDNRDKVAREARGLRLQAVSKIIDVLPNDHLEFIPNILSETIISTKDQNAEARNSAYDLLVKMGHKMKEGGSVNQAEIVDMPEDAPTTDASLQEYFVMLSAGLAGGSPHMISATVTALSRVVYEFRDEIEVDFLSNLADTVKQFLEHKSREIVGSTLGFVKITAVSLPIELVEPQLQDLIEHMLVWGRKSPDGGKAEFKNKIKNIIERMIRRFGYDKIEAVFPEEDKKLLTNIRKTKERNKRNKGKEQEQGQAKKPQKAFASEFDRALYESDSEHESDEEEAVPQKKGSKYILEGEDEPMDFLDNKSMAKISSTKPKNHQDKKKSQKGVTKNEEGRIVVKEDDGEDGDVDLDVAGGVDAYVQAVKNGPVKGQRNRLKYKRGRKNQEESDDESDVEDTKNGNGKRASSSSGTKKPQKQQPGKSNKRLKKQPKSKL